MESVSDRSGDGQTARADGSSSAAVRSQAKGALRDWFGDPQWGQMRRRGLAVCIGLAASYALFLAAFVVGDLMAGGLGTDDGREAAAGAGHAEIDRRPTLLLSLRVDEGWLVSHDLHLTNTSGQNLTESRLTVQVIGEDAAPAFDRYWASWSLGQTQLISIPVEEVRNIQRVTISGSADQGVFDQTFTVDK
jgi:hypothetical protein